MLDRIEADCAELDRLLHRRMQIGELETFQQSQNLHVFPPTMLGHAAFHQPAQRGELVRQIPALQRSGLIQRIDLLLDQRQIMDRVEDDTSRSQLRGWRAMISPRQPMTTSST